ncbi:uncharacterized protein LOC131060950 [Cryptomeria japonica]|uniref:uncharacterized protein LOC131060950 n=1 Tax=Cryptomeria japonica TaxID=3369 RepID=UPI0027DA5C14|nr:uncharacterized protein LOC131060950 [Cryptomeria japonica]
MEKISLMIDNKSWNNSVSFFRERGFFVKCFGDWLAVGKMKSWCTKTWKCNIELKTLPNGFFLVITEDNKDKHEILNNGPVFMGGRGLYIRDWEPNFNPVLAPIEMVHVWLRLYNLPREYWNEDFFQALGNKMGFFIRADEAIETKDFSMYARICIGWKPHYPLPEQVEIITNAGQWLQKIEMEESNETCQLCKKEGHSEETCLIGPKGKAVETTIEDEVNFFASKVNISKGMRPLEDEIQANQNPILQGEVSKAPIITALEEEENVPEDDILNKHREAAGWVEEAITRVEKVVDILDEVNAKTASPTEAGTNVELNQPSEKEMGSRLDYEEVKDNRELEGAEEDDDWGWMDEEDIVEIQTIEQSKLTCTKIRIGEKRLRGRKSNQFKIAMAGSAKGQSKLTVGKGVTLPEGQ